MKKKLIISALALLTILVGFFRDHIFVSINASIEAGRDVEGKLAILKWVLTGSFCILYLGLTAAFLKVLFGNQEYLLIAVFCYVFLFVVASVAGLAGFLFSSFESVYPFIRTVLGMAQSPVVFMFLIPAFYLISRKNSD